MQLNLAFIGIPIPMAIDCGSSRLMIDIVTAQASGFEIKPNDSIKIKHMGDDLIKVYGTIDAQFKDLDGKVRNIT